MVKTEKMNAVGSRSGEPNMNAKKYSMHFEVLPLAKYFLALRSSGVYYFLLPFCLIFILSCYGEDAIKMDN